MHCEIAHLSSHVSNLYKCLPNYYLPAEGESNSLTCPLYGQTLPLWNLTGGYHSDLQDYGVAVSISVTWASGVERGELLSGEIFLLFVCLLVWLFEICSSISTLLNTPVSVNYTTTFVGADGVFFSDDEKVKGMATEGGRGRKRVGRDSVVWYNTNEMLITKCQSVSNKWSPFLIIFYNWSYLYWK